MKKIIVMFMACLLCISIVSCDKSEKKDAIELTLENVEDYLEINPTAKPGYTERCMYLGDWVDLYNSISCNVEIKGNPNYEYENVVVGIRFYHLSVLNKELVSEQTVYVDLNLAGNGDASTMLATPVKIEGWDNISSETHTFYSYENISHAIKTTGYEIVSVQGSATKN